MKLDLYISPVRKLNSKFNVRPESIKLLEEMFQDSKRSKDILGKTPKSTDNKSKNRQMGLHQTKKLP
jgi:hypothetical protein